MKTFMFPGQGSQKKGMGGDLFDEFAELTQRADQILGYSIKQLCLEDPRKELAKTQFTQPALYVVNALFYFKAIEEIGHTPDFVIGHSLGEFNALMAAGCFSFESGLKLVKKRGELMSQVTGGGMAAISNASKQQIEHILAENGLENVNLANFNTPSQIVISGMKEEIEKAKPLFAQGDIMYHPLATSGAFHSIYMAESQKEFTTYLSQFKFAELQIPVIANVTAQPYVNEQIMDKLSSQIASPVLWSSSIEYLINIGAKAGDEMTFVEIGHGKVLAGLVRKIVRELTKADKMPQIKAVDETQSTPSMVKSGEPIRYVNAQQQVDAWNKLNPIGTKVKSLKMGFDNLRTRSEAVVLFGHRSAVYMQSYNGYFDLNEVNPM